MPQCLDLNAHSVCCWARFLASLGLSILIWKMGIVPWPHRAIVGMEGHRCCVIDGP